MPRESRSDSPAAPDLQPGLVVEHRGKSLTIEDRQGQRIRCRIRSKLGQTAVGDEVMWLCTQDGQGRVEQILPRRSLLSRPARQGQTRPVAANLDQLVVLLSIKPDPDLLLLDQYLVMAEDLGLSVLVIVNKSDLPETDKLLEALRVYAQLGYPVLEISAKQDQGMDVLKQQLQSHRSILVGQSGVGKSTLTNRLLPGMDLVTREVSQSTGHGRHTTTSTSLYRLPEKGELIDSPGVNVFGLAEIDHGKLAQGFREIAEATPTCKFHNCQHLNEPGCEVKLRLEQGRIDPGRYARYLKLRDKLAI